MSVAEICDGGGDAQRQHGGQPDAGQLRRAGGADRLCASLGDGLTRLDRIETALNEATPGDPRDTTTPDAMLGIMQRLLSATRCRPHRAAADAWLLASKTGDKRLRAGLPTDWRVGDKTGSGDNGTDNDIAVALAAGACADPDRGLLHRLDDRRRRAQRGHRRRGSPGGRRARVEQSLLKLNQLTSP